MAGTAALEFGMLSAQRAMATEAGTHGVAAVEGHEAAFRFAASALNVVASGIGAAGSIGRFFFRGAVVADGAARLVMAGITGYVGMGSVVEGYRHAGRFFTTENDGIGRKLDLFPEVLCLGRSTPGQGEKNGKDKKRFHALSPGR